MEDVPPYARKNPAVGNHVWYTALVAWPLAMAILLSLFLFGFPKRDVWIDTLIVVSAFPCALVMFGVYAGVIHLLFRKHRTKRLVKGLVLHLLLYGTSMLALFLIEKVHGK